MPAPTATVNKVRYRLVDVNASNPILATSTTLEEAIVNAVTKYAQDRPLIVTEDETGLTSGFIPVVGSGAVLASWLDRFSRVIRIEYPAEAVSSTYTPTYLLPEDWEEGYKDSSKTYIRLKGITPSSSEIVRITYTAKPVHTSLSDTVPAIDLDALCDLAAHYGCLALATKYSAGSDSVIAADGTNYRDNQLRFRQCAEDWLKSYNDKMGISNAEGGQQGGADSISGQSVRADWDQSFQFNRIPFLTHSPRWR